MTFLTLTSRAFLCNAEFPMPTYLTASTPDRNMLYMESSNIPIQFFPGTFPTPADNFPPCNTTQYETHLFSAQTREGKDTSTASGGEFLRFGRRGETPLRRGENGRGGMEGAGGGGAVFDFTAGGHGAVLYYLVVERMFVV
eukprot:CCRYP_007787-RB/>CCRYP_007787-RB protein AED:0.49 eAED:1.00 QI:0/0/0/1/0/0/2/0/140